MAQGWGGGHSLGRAGALKATSLWQYQTGEKPFLTFEVVSLVPYDRNLIDLSLLSPEQVLGGCLGQGSRAVAWGQHVKLGYRESRGGWGGGNGVAAGNQDCGMR